MLLRDLRVAAMTDAPAAFASTLQREHARTVDDWRRWFSPGVTFLWFDEADAGGGLVAAVVEAASGSAELASMWVRPDLRGQGVGDALMEAVVEWAQGQGLSLRLRVVEDNAPAVALYLRHGFQPTGDGHVRPDGVREVQMLHLAG
jgi:GNAT superfamily N-acetyltransferase